MTENDPGPTQPVAGHYRELFDAIDQGFCTIEVLFDENGTPNDYRFLDVNRAFEHQTGLRGAVGRRIRELAPGHEEHWFRLYGDVAVTGRPARFEQEAAALNRWYEVYAFRVGAPPLRRVAVLFNDITQRRQVELALQASEMRYRELARATTNALYRFNAGGTHLVEVYGGNLAPHATSTDSSASWIKDYVHPDDRERVLQTWRTGIASGNMFEIEHRGRLSDGSWAWLLSRTVPVRDAAGRIVEWIGSASDITARRHADEALRRSEAEHAAARREAEQANRAKDEFLAMLGHELRNPLAPMLTALQLMTLRGMQSREQDVLDRQVRHLTRMVDDLLDVSRVTRGKIELRRRPIELHDVVRRAMELAGQLLEQRRATVDVQVPVGVGIHADPDRMAQVLTNLLANAAKFSEPGSRIVIAGQRTDGIVRISCRDEGIGIAPGMLQTVFEPFVQQPQSLDRAGGGLGLGLAIVRNLVTAHGGTVRAESAGQNRGSELIVELPAVDVPADDRVNVEPSTPRATRDRLRILVVDDNQDAAAVLRSALEHLGYVVDVAFDGPSALARADAFRPSLVLLDIGLPLMDGYEVARQLRARHHGEQPLHLLALTGYGRDGDHQRSRDAGIDHHLVKPVDIDRLHQLIEHVNS